MQQNIVISQAPIFKVFISAKINNLWSHFYIVSLLIFIVIMKNQQINYLSPRLAILKVEPNNKQNLLECEIFLRSRHKNYFHIFNLSSYHFAESKLGTITTTHFKWRQIPYSITEAIKILATLEAYQSINKANTAIIAVSDEACFQFALFVSDLYSKILGINLNNPLKLQKPHALTEFFKVYKTINIQNPPIKIINTLAFKFPQEAFIPIVKIFSQARHNNFEQTYADHPQPELMKYYLDKKSPLSEGVGQKFCTKMPQTKHLARPVLVFGDVKVQIYSYTTLKLQKQFSCGFNTKCLEYDQTLVQLVKEDFYEIKNSEKISKKQEIQIEISDYCEKCPDQAKCEQCIQVIKKLGNTYHLAQLELQKIGKNRGAEDGRQILG